MILYLSASNFGADYMGVAGFFSCLRGYEILDQFMHVCVYIYRLLNEYSVLELSSQIRFMLNY